MASFYDGVNFGILKEEANRNLTNLNATCDGASSLLEDALDHDSYVAIIGAIVGIVLWGIYYSFFYILDPDISPGLFGLMFVLSASGVVVFRLIDLFAEIKHLKMVRGYMRQIAAIQERIDQWQKTISGESDKFIASSDDGWSVRIDPAESVYEKVSVLQDEVKHIKKMDALVNKGIETFLAFIVSETATVMGASACYQWIIEKTCNFFYNLIGYELSNSVVFTILVIATIIAVIAEAFLFCAVIVGWSKGINNLTLGLTMAGPVLFGVIVAAIAISPLAVFVALMILLVKKKNGLINTKQV